MQLLGGLINDALALLFFIYFSLLVSGKIKLKQAKQEKLDHLMLEKGKFIKTLAYVGTILFTIITIKSFIAYRNNNSGSNLNQQKSINEWTKAQKDAMIKDCIENAKISYKKDPTGTTAVCECATEKFTSKYNPVQANEITIELNKKTMAEKTEFFKDILNGCRKDTTSPK